MPPIRPRAELDTHAVTNQPPPLPSYNAFADDPLMRPPGLEESETLALLGEFGARCGSEEARELGRLANENPPRLRAFDRYGQR